MLGAIVDVWANPKIPQALSPPSEKRRCLVGQKSRAEPWQPPAMQGRQVSWRFGMGFAVWGWDVPPDAHSP